MTYLTHGSGNHLLLDILTDCEQRFERGQTAAAMAHTKARATLQKLIANWHAQSAVACLSRLDDKVLCDFRIERNDLDWAQSLLLSVNSMEALEERVRQVRPCKTREPS